MDIKSPAVLKLKGALFAFLGCLSGALLLAPTFTWRDLLLLLITVWAFCRAYYFCFYVLEHYAGEGRYAGLLDLVKRTLRGKRH